MVAVRNPWVVVFCAAAIVTLSTGVRQSFGLFMQPISVDLDIGRQSFGLAIAIQNLLFGLATPFVGVIADRHGAGRVVLGGTLLYVAGLVIAAYAGDAADMHVSLGVLVGLGLSATTFVVVFGAVARAVPPEKRGLAMGIATAGGSIGQFLLVPGAQALIGELGFRLALLVLAGVVAIAAVLAIGVSGRPASHSEQSQAVSLKAALGEAAGSRSFWLLNAGFFVCGFHIAFIGTHFPAYLTDRGLGPTIGATALALIGLFNIFGSWVFGFSGDRFRKHHMLAALYAARAVAIGLFAVLPLTAASTLVFSAVMGFLWLGTVPLTSGLVGQIFGVRYFSTLYGVVFGSHQLGSFLGAWAAGYAYDMTGNYDFGWGASLLLAVAAAIIHLPIRDAPIARPQPA